jgi:hypothetical protein
VGRGDWLHRFLQQASQIMRQQKDHIYLPALDTAVSVSLPPNAQGIFSAVLEEAHVVDQVKRIHSVSANNPSGKRTQEGRNSPFSSSWDLFSLYAKVEWPLSLVFTDTVQRKYQLLFRTMLVWRRLEKKLGKCWKSPTRIPQFDRIRHSMTLFVTGYLSFTSTVIVHTHMSLAEEGLRKTSDIEDIFRIHEDALDSAMKGFFLTDPKCFDLLISIAQACTQFVVEFKKWRITVNHEGISREAKLRHGKPMKMFFDVFEKKVQQLIQILIALANREANQMYTDFVRWINLNDVYVHYLEGRVNP